jgi:lysophospholipase L1-like esterase
MKHIFAILTLLFAFTVAMNAQIGGGQGIEGGAAQLTGGYQTPSGIGTKIPNQTAFAYNFSPNLLPHWISCAARVKANVGNCRILMLGDSTTFGINSTASDTGDLTAANYPTDLATYLNSIIMPANRASFFGCGAGGGTGTSGGNCSIDPRITLGQWSVTSAVTSVGGFAIQDNGSGSSLNFAPTTSVNTFKIWYVTHGGGGEIYYALDGGSTTGFSTNGSTGIGSQVVTATTPGQHILNLTCPSCTSNTYIVGIEAYNTNIGSIDIMNAGWPGASSGNWNVTGPYAPLTTAVDMAPDVVIIDLGINDWKNNGVVSLATYQANMGAIIAALQATSDVILVTPAPSYITSTSVALQQDYVAVQYVLSKQYNVPLIDNFSRWGTYAIANAAPLLFESGDGYHPNATGYADFAQAVAGALLQPVGQLNDNSAPLTVSIPHQLSAGPYAGVFQDFIDIPYTLVATSIGTNTGGGCGTTGNGVAVTVPGVVTAISGTGVGGTGTGCATSGNAGWTSLQTAPTWYFETRVLVNTLPTVTSDVQEFGLDSFENTAPWSNGVGFEVAHANATPDDWYCAVGSTLTDSTVAVLSDVWYRLAMYQDGANLHYYINGTEVTACETAITNIPSNAMAFYFNMVTGSTGTSLFNLVDYYMMNRNVVR